MATVSNVAKYILQKLGATTAMKLQKLYYYAQAWSLAWNGMPLFEEDFEAWANGPVCPKLFKRHKGLFIVDASLFANIPDYTFTASEAETIDEVLKYYGDKKFHWLSELTHQEQPWRLARAGIPKGIPSSNVISKESMQEYYGGYSP